jgi:RNA polymerase sigma-54 factor
MEPRGLFARSLAECLRLQASEAGLLDQTMSQVLDHLDLLARTDTAKLAKICAVSEADILACARRIRSLDPKPGAQFDQGAAPVREPDLTLTRSATAWQVALNRSAFPEVRVVRPKDGEANMATSLTAARNLAQIVNNRNTTLLRIATEVLVRQTPAFEHGLEKLRPMTMAEVGAALSLHEGTISRAIAGVSMDTPRGTMWLRSLFTGAVGDTAISGGAMRARLAQLVATEDRKKPMGDEALAMALSQDGAQIARRTIAKYREMLHIPAAHRRRSR